MGGVIIAGTQSDIGKTTITMGILRAFIKQGIIVSSAKVGPDYIDPVFHRTATGTDCYNLDLWAMRSQTIHGILHHLQSISHMVVIEGVMGLFDGASGGVGSTADVARLTGYPIILVIDCAKQSTSISALIHGFDSLIPDIHIAGVILNKVGSQKHRHILCESIKYHLPHIPIMGIIQMDSNIQLPSRHLGLIQGAEHTDLKGFIDTLADICTQHVDLTALQACADTTQSCIPPTAFPTYPPLGTHIAISRDIAFQFLYPHIQYAWEQAGATLSYFSPLNDEIPHPDADAVYLCGGYPELHLPVLANAHNFQSAIRNAVKHNIPVYGECGGYMIMGKSIIGADKQRYNMIGVLNHITDFYNTRRTLSYQTASAIHPTHRAFQQPMKGHTYHYATTHTPAKTPFIRLQNTHDSIPYMEGGIQNSAFGSFFHIIDYVPQQDTK